MPAWSTRCAAGSSSWTVVSWSATRPTASMALTAPRPRPGRDHRPVRRWNKRHRVRTATSSPTASRPAPDAGLRVVRLTGGRHQPVAQPPDDRGRHLDRGRLPRSGGLVAPVEAGRVEGHRAVAEPVSYTHLTL